MNESIEELEQKIKELEEENCTLYEQNLYLKETQCSCSIGKKKFMLTDDVLKKIIVIVNQDQCKNMYVDEMAEYINQRLHKDLDF